MMEGQGHLPPGTNLQKCDFCYATFNTLSELICHSCIHAPGNPPNRDLYQAQNILTKANFNNHGFANLDDIARHNRLHVVDTHKSYNNFYDAPFTSSSQLNFSQQIPAAHQQIPPAHQQIPTVHQAIFQTEKPYSCNFREAAYIQQSTQGPIDSGQTTPDHLSFNPELFHNPSFTATKVPPGMTLQKKPLMKDPLTAVEPKPMVPRKRKTGTGERNHKCYLCGAAFLKRSHLVEHLPIHTGERPFKCDICGQTFIKKSDLARHNLTHTGEKPFKCEYCDAAYTRKSILRQHILIHTNEKPFKCTHCIAAFNKKSDLMTHTLIHTGEKPYKCDTCDSAFTTKNQLKDHKAMHTGEKLHKCILCGASFKRRKGLKRHHRIHSGKKPHKCDQCTAAFVEKSQLKVHMRIHTNEKPFKCDQCGAAFRQKGLLTIHQNIHQGAKQFKCDQCTASFSQKCNLTIHKRVHSGSDQFNQYLYQPSYTATRIQLNMLNKSRKMEINEATAKLLEELTPRPRKIAEKNHKCTYCDAAFTRKNLLQEHILTHTGEKPYKCKICEETFSKRSDLSKHKQETHPNESNKVHKCKKCDATFPKKSSLNKHMQTHANEGPFKCKYCTGMFMKKSDLEEHQVTHSGTKSFICDSCDAAFTTKTKLKEHKQLHKTAMKLLRCKICKEEFQKLSSLNRHIKTHEEELLFKCATCNSTFAEKKELKEHLKTHNTVKPYSCKLCEATFAQKSQLKFHKKSHQGNKPFKCNICSASFSRKPSLVNHQIMHKRKAQEREYLDLKEEPLDDEEFTPRTSRADDDPDFLPPGRFNEDEDTDEDLEMSVVEYVESVNKSIAKHTKKGRSSNKRKAGAQPRRRTKVKHIQYEVKEEFNEDLNMEVEEESNHEREDEGQQNVLTSKHRSRKRPLQYEDEDDYDENTMDIDGPYNIKDHFRADKDDDQYQANEENDLDESKEDTSFDAKDESRDESRQDGSFGLKEEDNSRDQSNVNEEDNDIDNEYGDNANDNNFGDNDGNISNDNRNNQQDEFVPRSAVDTNKEPVNIRSEFVPRSAVTVDTSKEHVNIRTESPEDRSADNELEKLARGDNFPTMNQPEYNSISIPVNNGRMSYLPGDSGSSGSVLDNLAKGYDSQALNYSGKGLYKFMNMAKFAGLNEGSELDKYGQDTNTNNDNETGGLEKYARSDDDRMDKMNNGSVQSAYIQQQQQQQQQLDRVQQQHVERVVDNKIDRMDRISGGNVPQTAQSYIPGDHAKEHFMYSHGLSAGPKPMVPDSQQQQQQQQHSGYNSGPYGNSYQQAPNIDPQKLNRPVWPSY